MVFARIAALVVVCWRVPRRAGSQRSIPAAHKFNRRHQGELRRVRHAARSRRPDAAPADAARLTSPARAGCSSTTCAARFTRSPAMARRVACISISTIRNGTCNVNSAGQRARLPELRVPSAVHADRARRASESSIPTSIPSNKAPTPDWVQAAAEAQHTHDAVLLEWTAKNPAAAAYDGEAPRELMRLEHPFGNHNGGQLAFNPLAAPTAAKTTACSTSGIADGGSGGDPLNMSQNLELGVRQDAAHRSARQRTAQTASTAFRKTTRSSTTTIPRRSVRSTRRVCAIRSALRGTRATATCSSPTSDRTSSKR